MQSGCLLEIHFPWGTMPLFLLCRQKAAHHATREPQFILKAVFRLLLILVLCMLQILWLKYNSHEMLQCHYECLLIKWKTDFKSRSFLLKKRVRQSPDFPLLINFNTALSISSAGQRNAGVFIVTGTSVIPSQISNIKVFLLWLLGQGTHRSLIISFSFRFYFKLCSSVW